MDSTVITAFVLVGILALAVFGMVGVVRRGRPVSKVIGWTMLIAIGAGLAWAAIMVAFIPPMQDTA